MGTDPAVDIPCGVTNNTIFIRTPNFKISAGGFPVKAEYSIVGNTMFLTVR